MLDYIVDYPTLTHTLTIYPSDVKVATHRCWHRLLEHLIGQVALGHTQGQLLASCVKCEESENVSEGIQNKNMV